jgi:hypothetical protein
MAAFQKDLEEAAYLGEVLQKSARLEIELKRAVEMKHQLVMVLLEVVQKKTVGRHELGLKMILMLVEGGTMEHQLLNYLKKAEEVLEQPPLVQKVVVAAAHCQVVQESVEHLETTLLQIQGKAHCSRSQKVHLKVELVLKKVGNS